MPDLKAEFQEKLDAIRNEYAQDSLPVQLSDVAKAAEAVLELGPEQNATEHLETLHATSHKLTGSSGTFGFPDISSISREISSISANEGPIGDILTASDKDNIRQLVENLKNSPEFPAH